MAATYQVGTTFFDAVASTDRLNLLYAAPNDATLGGVVAGVAGGYPVSIETAALFAIFNDSDSEHKIQIIDLLINEMQARTTTGVVQRWTMNRVSAMSGGLENDIIKLDTDQADLPPEVLVRRRADATLTGGNLRAVLDLPQLNATRAVEYQHAWRTGDGSVSTGRMYGCTNSEMQPQVLREGQGLAVLCTGGLARENWPVEVSIWFDDGTNYYLTREVLAPGVWAAPMGIFNGAGSGVVLNVRKVELAEIMQDTTTAPVRFTIEPISGIHRNSTKALVPQAMDTTNPELPSTIRLASPATVVQASQDSVLAAPFHSDEAPLRRLNMVPYGAGPGLTSAWAFHGLGGSNLVNSRFDGRFGDTAYTLRPGEGIAVFQRDNITGWGQGYWMRLTFTVESLPGKEPARGGVIYVS